MNALASQFAGVRLTPARAAPASASRRGVVCVASATAETGRLPAAKVKKVTFDGKAAGEATMHLHSAPEDSAKGLVHRYLVMVRQNARRVSFGSGSRPRRYRSTLIHIQSSPAAGVELTRRNRCGPVELARPSRAFARVPFAGDGEHAHAFRG